LLVFKSPVAGYEDLESRLFRGLEQIAILETAPTQMGNRDNLMLR